MIERLELHQVDALVHGPAVRGLADLLPEQEVDLVALKTRVTGWAGRTIPRALAERFQAITNIGLTQDNTGGAPLQRQVFRGGPGRANLSYLAAGDPAGQRVLFIHGTPGAASDWAPFLRNAPAGQHRIAIDRPGFGASGPGAPVVALADQARAIARFLEADGRPATVVGSSYGGPVALKLAAEHPEAVAGVLLVGSAADPAREDIHPVQHIVAMRALRPFLPRALAHSNAELLALRGELEDLADRIARIPAPVTVLQGLDDTLVPMDNAAYIARRLTRSARRRVILVRDTGHFLHILFSDLVEHALDQVLNDLSGATRPGAPDAPRLTGSPTG